MRTIDSRLVAAYLNTPMLVTHTRVPHWYDMGSCRMIIHAAFSSHSITIVYCLVVSVSGCKLLHLFFSFGGGSDCFFEKNKGTIYYLSSGGSKANFRGGGPSSPSPPPLEKLF